MKSPIFSVSEIFNPSPVTAIINSLATVFELSVIPKYFVSLSVISDASRFASSKNFENPFGASPISTVISLTKNETLSSAASRDLLSLLFFSMVF